MDEERKGLQNFADAASRCAEAFRNCATAFTVLSMELREYLDEVQPQNTAAREMAEAAIARAWAARPK